MVSLYILSRARVVGTVGKMAVFGRFLTPSWTKSGSVFDPLFGQLSGNPAQKRDFTCSETEGEIDHFVFFKKNNVFCDFCKNLFFRKKAKMGKTQKTQKSWFSRGETTRTMMIDNTQRGEYHDGIPLVLPPG